MAKVTYLKARDTSLAAGGHDPVAAFTIPVTNGLVVASLFSGGVAMAGRNYAPGAADGVVKAAPSEPGRYVRFDAAAVDTGVPEILGGTVMVIGRSASGKLPYFVGSRRAGTSEGFSLFATAQTAVIAQFETASGTDAVNVAATMTQWNMFCATIPATGGGAKVRNLTAGAEAVSASTANRANTGADTISVGGTPSVQATWGSDMLLAMVWSRVLSEAEIAAVAVWGRTYAADFGVTV